MNGTRPTQVRWLIFGLACAASWLLYLHRYSWGVVKPYFKEENPDLSDIDIGWLDSAFQATYGLGQVPAGFLGDLLGPRGLLSASILFWSVASVAVIWVSGFWALAFVRGTFGLTQAAAYPVISKMTRNWFALSVRTSVQGVVTALGRLGAASCPLIVATLLMAQLHLTWQAALLVLFIPGVLLAIAFYIAVRNSPREHPWSNEAEQQLIGEPAPALSADQAARKPKLEGGSTLSLLMLLLYAFASTFQDQIYVYWIPLFLVDGHGMSKGEMGVFTPLPLVGGAIGGIIGGLLNDYLIRRTGNRRWSRSLVGFTGKFIQADMVVWCVQMGDGVQAMAVLFVARIVGDCSLPTQWGAITDMGGRAAGTLFGLVNTAGAIGGFAAGPVFGTLKHYYGWEGVFFGAAAMCLVASLTWLFIDCTKKLVAD